MEIPAPAELIERIRSLPAGRPLLERLQDEPGVYLVGGAVRDLLLGGAPLDLDLVVEGDPAGFASRLGGMLVFHERFGTSRVRLDGHQYDIAQARRERYPSPGALPEVTPASLAEDLLRRDFTVNAIAIALSGAEAGTVQAAPDGLEDLDRGWLRVLHQRSFVDDPTRLLRLARYRARLGFEIEPGTAGLAASALEAGALDTVSGPRIGTEVRLLASEADPLEALRGVAQLGIDQARGGTRLGLTEAGLEVGRRAMALLPAEGRRDRLALGLAAQDVAAPVLHRLLDRLAFEVEDRQVILAVAARAGQVAQALSAAERASQIAEVAGGLPLELIALAGALGPADRARDWFERLRHVGLQIDGEDLLRAGVPEGPAIGRGLRAALSARLDGLAEGRDAELAAALKGAQGTQ